MNHRLTALAFVLVSSACATSALAQPAKVELTWMSIANWDMNINGKRILMDAYISRLPDSLFVPAPGKEIELVTRLDPDLSPSRLDPAQFESAILNLVMNARDAISGAGRIVIETHNVELGADFAIENPDMASGRYVMVTVSDTGAGMSDDIIYRVFDPFFTTKGIGEGAGLGLSQVYGFTKESGGHVRIDSTVGVGTTVRLCLPRADEVPVEQAEASVRTAAAKAETVLVVEDDAELCAMVADNLRALGYRVLTAANAPAALAVAEREPRLDLLFSDYSMPFGMLGDELARRARRLKPGLKVLLTSGYAVAAAEIASADFSLLQKPYRPDELARAIRQTLDRT